MNASSGSINDRHRCWAEIDLAQLRRNLAVYRAQLPAGSEIMAVVKADAYGHGAKAVARALYEDGIRRFAIATAAEGIQLRPLLPEAELLILGYTPVEDAALLSAYRLTQALVSREYADALADAAEAPIDCCYAVDTGMRRIGLNAEEIDGAEAAIRAVRPPLRLTGLFTHLCVADAPQDAECAAFTRRQTALFDALAERVKDLRLSSCHCLNSAGGLYLARPGTARLGIILYGLRPDASNVLPEGIRPVLSWKCRVAMVKRVRPGDTVGYGRTWAAGGERLIATLTVGYADGYSRALSNRGWALLHGRRAPITGRVCMDQIMVDVTDIPETRMGDTAVLLGTDGDEALTADDMAALTGTIGYEIVCNISKRVPRIVSGDRGEDIRTEEIAGPSAVSEAAVREKYGRLTRLLIARGVTITAMESCTAGQIASLITDTEGSSAVLKGAFVTYSNEAKAAAGVRAAVIEEHGVYSPEAAAAMARACREAFSADIGIGVTGSFGNIDPNNADSVPGEVWFAVSASDGVTVCHCAIPRQPSRLMYKLYMADLVADEVLKQLKRG